MNTPLNILVVENDPNVRAIIEVSLGLDALIAVRTAASGAEAFAIVTSGIIAFDGVLLAGTVQDMAGIRLIEALAGTGKYRRLPIVILAAARPGDRLGHDRNGAVLAVITTPFDPLTLAEDIRCHLAQAARRGTRRDKPAETG